MSRRRNGGVVRGLSNGVPDRRARTVDELWVLTRSSFEDGGAADRIVVDASRRAVEDLGIGAAPPGSWVAVAAQADQTIALDSGGNPALSSGALSSGALSSGALSSGALSSGALSSGALSSGALSSGAPGGASRILVR